MSRIVARWLDLPESQLGRAARMLALVFFLSAGLALMKAAQSGIFLAACSRAAIPWAFAASSVLLALLSAGFVSLARRFSTVRLGELALALSVASLVVLWALARSGDARVAFSTYAVIEALSGVLVIQVWSVATAATDARTARRLLPVAGIGSSVAWTLSGFLVSPLAAWAGARGLLLAAPLLLLLALLCVRALGRHDLALRERAPSRATSSGGSILRTLRFVARVPLLRIMTALSLLALIVEEVMDLHVMSVAREELVGAEALSAFFGRYYAWTSALGIVLLAGPAARILGGLGATRSLATTPAVTLVAALVASVVPGLGPAVALRGTARVLKQALWSNAQEQMQSPIAHARRAETRAAIRGVLAPGGYAVAAVLLALVPAHVDGRWLAGLVALLSAGMLALVVSGARRAYLRALERAVDERRLVLGAGRLRRAPTVDREAVELLAKEIESPDPDRAELAAEVLGAATGALAREALVRGLAHASVDVRRAAAEALGRLADPDSLEALARALGTEPTGAIRPVIAESLRRVVDARPSALEATVLASLLAGAADEPDPRVRATLLALAARRGRTGPALGSALVPLLTADDPYVRRAGLGELTAEALAARGVVEAVRRSLEHGTADEKVDAAETAVALGVIVLLPDVVALLRDPTVSTRVARLLVALGDDAFGTPEDAQRGQTTLASLTLMAQRIARRGERSDALVRRLLAHRDRTIRRAAVQALAEAVRTGERPPLPSELGLPLVRGELAVAFRLLAVDAALERVGEEHGARPRELPSLRREVALRLEAGRADVLVLLSLLAQRDPMVASRWSALVEAVEASRRTPSEERDAQVAELLENALGPELRAPIVALFERLPPAERLEAGRAAGLLDGALNDPLEALLGSGDAHLRAAAAAVYGPERAARHASLGPEELAMIPRFERIRFLRRVPLFATLPGEDLVSVAGVLEELELADGQAVFHRGDRGEDLYVVVQGRIAIGEPGHVLAELGETEFFGDLAVLDHEGRSADAVCVGPTKLLRLRGADLRELMVTRPEITQGIVRVLVARLRDAGRKLAG
jgi:HEAT repeat protein